MLWAKMKNYIRWAFAPAKVVIHQSITWEIWRAFWYRSLAYVEIFAPFKFEIWVSCKQQQNFWSFATFVFGFSVWFLKWNSILCQIYWKLDLQSLKLVCFVNTKSENMQIPDFFWQEGLLTYSYSPCRHRSKKSSKWNKLQQKVFQRNIVS